MAPSSRVAVIILLLACSSGYAVARSGKFTSDKTAAPAVSPECEMGDGVGGTEEYIATAETISECIDLVKSERPNANGATISATLPGSCYAEFGMKESDGSESWRTCKIDPACIQGDGVGGTEEWLADEVASWADCIDLVKSKRPFANGATISATIPGSCYAEFGMEESNGSDSWFTCEVDPACVIGDGVGGTEEWLANVASEAECIDLVKSMHSTANGVTFSATFPGSCYAEFGMEESNGSESWRTCKIEPACVMGDGTGGTEEQLSDYVNSAADCVDLVKSKRPNANGATHSATLPGSCYAEFGMEESNGSEAWRTCKIDPACIQGDGVGGTEEWLADEVASWADCVDLVKSKRPNANGATISATLPGSCYAEFGMEESNGSDSWFTCEVEPACIMGDGTGGTEEQLSDNVNSAADCIAMVQAMRPDANGATYSATLPGSCYAEFGMEESNGSDSWFTCEIEPGCVMGDGTGGTEEQLSDNVNSAADCIAMVQAMRPGANGATYSATLPGSCYAEFGMEESNGSESWMTCKIDPACIQGDGVGGTEEWLADEVASWADCIGLVKSKRPNANGATISATLPGSCYAEFGMEESNGSGSWFTCEVYSACVIGDGTGGTEEQLSDNVNSAADCIDMVQAMRPDANGATYSATLPGSCYAEFGMDESNGSESWRTCKIEPACVQGDGIGGTEEYLIEVNSRSECIKAVKSMHPDANGATYSAALPGSCYAEFNMRIQR